MRDKSVTPHHEGVGGRGSTSPALISLSIGSSEIRLADRRTKEPEGQRDREVLRSNTKVVSVDIHVVGGVADLNLA